MRKFISHYKQESRPFIFLGIDMWLHISFYFSLSSVIFYLLFPPFSLTRSIFQPSLLWFSSTILLLSFFVALQFTHLFILSFRSFFVIWVILGIWYNNGLIVLIVEREDKRGILISHSPKFLSLKLFSKLIL